MISVAAMPWIVEKAFIETYVPEAAENGMTESEALALALERDKEAAEQLRLDAELLERTKGM
jgi:hypothetical protein